MSTNLVSIRRAKHGDEAMLARVFDAAWPEAYRGVIPGVALERFIAKRSVAVWRAMLGRGRALAVLEAGETIVAYAAYGRLRGRSLNAFGEVDEIYVAPEYQGLGFGSRLFRAVRNDLGDRGLAPVGVWVLADNRRARDFYERCGGRRSADALERISGACLPKIGYLFD